MLKLNVLLLCSCCVLLFQEVEFVLAPGQELYSLKFDVVFTNNIALSYFIGKFFIIIISSSSSSTPGFNIVWSANTSRPPEPVQLLYSVNVYVMVGAYLFVGKEVVLNH